MISLSFDIEEPLPGEVFCEMLPAVTPGEAARRYRAVVLTTLRQLKGAKETRIRLKVSPRDAEEAVRFWILPKLAEKWQRDGKVFRAGCDWEIDFNNGNSLEDFAVKAEGLITCPNLGARWVHTALLGIGRTISCVRGEAEAGGIHYFQAGEMGTLPERVLPRLPVIRTDADWQSACTGPLGGALKKAWEAE